MCTMGDTADACVATTLISDRCVPCHPWCTHRKSLVVKKKKIKKNFFSFLVAVKNSIKVGPLVFLLQMFVITENIIETLCITGQTTDDIMGYAHCMLDTKGC